MSIFAVPKGLQLTHPDDGPGKRGLIASQIILTGSTIFGFQPEIETLHSEPIVSDDSCWNCCSYCNESLDVPQLFNSASTNRIIHAAIITQQRCMCDGCGILKYCSKQCKLLDWKKNFHQLECSQLKNYFELYNRVPPIDEMIAIRLYYMIFNGKTLSIKNNKVATRIFNLTSHLNEITDSEISSHFYEKVRNVCKFIEDGNNHNKENLMNHPLSASGMTLSSRIASLLGIVIINSTVLQNSHNEDIGLMFDSVFSLINHSCDPNCCLVFERNQAKLVALKTINNKSEITVNYCFFNTPKEIRNVQLKKRYFFECGCGMCKNPVDRYFSYNCPHCGVILCGFEFDSFQTTPKVIFPTSKKQRRSKSPILDNACDNYRCISCHKYVEQRIVRTDCKIHRILLISYWYKVLGGNQGDRDDIFWNPINSVKLTSEITDLLRIYRNSQCWDDELEGKLDSVLQLLIQVFEAVYSDGDYDLDSMIALVDIVDSSSQYTLTSFSLEEINHPYYQILISILKAHKLVPMYCFPLSYYVSAMEVEFRDDCFSMKDHMRMLILYYYEVIIPCDCSEGKYQIGGSLKEISRCLLEAVYKLLQETDVTYPIEIVSTASEPQYKALQIVPMAMSSLFYSLQSYWYLKKIYGVEVPIIQEVKCLTIDVLRLSHNLRDHFPMSQWLNDDGLSDSRLSSCLMQFGDNIGLDFNLEKKISFADRTKKKIFHSCFELREVLGEFGIKF